MPVDKVELAKDLDTPEYQQVVAEHLTKKEFVVRDKATNEQFEQRFRTDVIEKEIPKKIAEVHSQYDKDIEAATGLKRDTNEKSYEFMKRGFTHVQSAGGDETLRKKIGELEDKIKTGAGSAADKKALTDLEATYKTNLAEKDQEIQKLKGEHTTSRKQTALQTSYGDLKGNFVKVLPAMFGRTEKMILADVATRVALDEDGKLYEVDKDGNFVKDKSFNKNPVDNLLKEEFKDVIDKGPKVKGGAGSGGSGGSKEKSEEMPDKITVDNYEMPDSIKSGGELMDHMMSLGIKRGSEEFTAIWNKHRPTLADAKNLKVPPAPVKK